MQQGPYVSLFVPGRPAPKGSWTADPSGHFRARASVDEWQAIVTGAARRQVAAGAGRPGRWVHYDGFPIQVPVSVDLCFSFLRPVKPQFDVPATTKTGDLDKLTRCVFDALTNAGVYADDALVCRSSQEAIYVDKPEEVGVWIQVMAL